jgi:hypothetical protein
LRPPIFNLRLGRAGRQFKLFMERPLWGQSRR